MHLVGYPNSLQMIYESYSKKLWKLLQKSYLIGQEWVLWTACDKLASLSPVNCFTRFLVLASVILIPTLVTLFALKCLLAYLHTIVE